jgi:hypothetical protein
MVVDPKRIIGKNGGLRRRRGTSPPQKKMVFEMTLSGTFLT